MLLSHIDFPGQVFHVTLQRVVVVEEGPESECFGGDDEAQNNRPEGEEANAETGDDGIKDSARVIAMQRLLMHHPGTLTFMGCRRIFLHVKHQM